MVGKAMGSATKTISSATGESMHTIAKKTRTDKVSAPCAFGGDVCPVIQVCCMRLLIADAG